MNKLVAVLLSLTAALGMAQTPIRLKLSHKEFLEGLSQLAHEQNEKNHKSGPVVMGMIGIQGNRPSLFPTPDKYAVADVGDLQQVAHNLEVKRYFDVLFKGSFQDPEELLKGTKVTGAFQRQEDRVIAMPLRFLLSPKELDTAFTVPQDKHFHPCPQTFAIGANYYPSLLTFENFTFSVAKSLCKDVKLGFFSNDPEKFLAYQAAYYKISNPEDLFVVDLTISYLVKNGEIVVKGFAFEVVNPTDDGWLSYAGTKNSVFRNVAYALSTSNVRVTLGNESELDMIRRANSEAAEKAATQQRFDREVGPLRDYIATVRKNFVSKGGVEKQYEEHIRTFFKDYLVVEGSSASTVPEK